PGAGGGGDLGKALAFNVLEHAVGDQHVVGRVASAEIEIEIAVVVEVPEVASHGNKDPVDAGFLADIDEALAAQVTVEPGYVPCGAGRLAEQIARRIGARGVGTKS